MFLRKVVLSLALYSFRANAIFSELPTCKEWLSKKGINEYFQNDVYPERSKEDEVETNGEVTIEDSALNEHNFTSLISVEEQMNRHTDFGNPHETRIHVDAGNNVWKTLKQRAMMTAIKLTTDKHKFHMRNYREEVNGYNRMNSQKCVQNPNDDQVPTSGSNTYPTVPRSLDQVMLRKFAKYITCNLAFDAGLRLLIEDGQIQDFRGCFCPCSHQFQRLRSIFGIPHLSCWEGCRDDLYTAWDLMHHLQTSYSKPLR